MEFKIEPIDGMHNALEGTIGEVLDDGNPVASENIQSRLRGIIVMAHANAQNRMAIATGNKSLYGDMAGGYTPLGDLYKMQVYAFAEIFNQRAIELGNTPPVNESTMTKPPSAELFLIKKMRIPYHLTKYSTKSYAFTSIAYDGYR